MTYRLKQYHVICIAPRDYNVFHVTYVSLNVIATDRCLE